jgi:hypothetical protein
MIEEKKSHGEFDLEMAYPQASNYLMEFIL